MKRKGGRKRLEYNALLDSAAAITRVLYEMEYHFQCSSYYLSSIKLSGYTVSYWSISIKHSSVDIRTIGKEKTLSIGDVVKLIKAGKL